MTLQKITKQTIGLFFVITMLCLSEQAVFAINSMGPPIADLEQEDFDIGAGFSHSRIDLELNDGKRVEYLDGWYDAEGAEPDLKLKDVKINTVHINVAYGAIENLEVFLRLGGTNARFTGHTFWPSGDDFDSNTDFAIGGGIKTTFYEEDKLKIGGLILIGWSELDGALRPVEWPVADDTVKFDLTEVRIAVGPSYELAEEVSIYGGPFLHFIRGDWDDIYNQIDPDTGGLLTTKSSWKVEEDSIFGVYLGAQLESTDNSTLRLEYQHTSGAGTFGAGLAFEF